jgi:hypothetical protein
MSKKKLKKKIKRMEDYLMRSLVHIPDNNFLKSQIRSELNE